MPCSRTTSRSARTPSPSAAATAASAATRLATSRIGFRLGSISAIGSRGSGLLRCDQTPKSPGVAATAGRILGSAAATAANAAALAATTARCLASRSSSARSA